MTGPAADGDQGRKAPAAKLKPSGPVHRARIMPKQSLLHEAGQLAGGLAFYRLAGLTG
jgi:hypothetical protein